MATPAASNAPSAAKARASGATEPAAAPIPATPRPAPSATQSRRPTADIAPPISGMPQWLEQFLLAAALLTAAAFAAEPVFVLARRGRQRGRNKDDQRLQFPIH